MKLNEHNLNLLLSAIAASIAILALGILIVYRAGISQEIRDQSMSNCQAIEQLKTQIRDGLAERRDIALRAEVDPPARAAIVAFYARAARRYAPISC